MNREKIKLKILTNILSIVTKKYDLIIEEKDDKLQELYYQATRDRLTGLYNRVYLLESLETKFAKAHREGKDNFYIVFIDLDNFKWINDNKGHEEGDRVLQEVAAILQESLREYDIIGRYGGDEFILFLEIDKEKLFKILHRIRQKVEEQFQNYNLSLSFGAASLIERNSIQEVLKLADERMYRDKFQRKAQR